MPIRFGTYNIRNERNRGLELALRGMSQAIMYLGIFQETKVIIGVYTRGSDGYSVVATDVPIRHRGMVAIFYRPSLCFAVEAVQQFGPNVVGFQLATGERRWYIVRYYLAPDDTSMIKSVVTALKERLRGAELLVAGDFNVKLSEPEGDRRGEDIAVALATEGLENMLVHFLPRQRSWCRGGRTWSMVPSGREVRSRTYYILGTDHRLFWNVSVRYPRHNSNHYLVLGCLRSAPLRKHSEYLGRRKRLPLRPPTTPTREDGLFTALHRAVPKPKARDARKNA